LADKLGDMRRTHHCNQLGAADVGREVVLMGWVQRRRDHGGVIFVDLRDREGITQVVFNPEINPEDHAKAHALRSEYVIGVRGRVHARARRHDQPQPVHRRHRSHGLRAAILNEPPRPRRS
jgi:aspartyl-tRNA synthetase